MISLLKLNFRWSSWSSLRDLLHLARWMFLYKRHENHQRNRLNHNCEQKALIIIIRKIINKITFLIKGMAFGGPYPGFTAPSQPGESDKKALVETHLKVTQYLKGTCEFGNAICYIDWNPKLAISKSAMTKGDSECKIAIINTELEIMMVVRDFTMSTIISVQVFKEQVEAAQEFSPTLINSHRSARI